MRKIFYISFTSIFIITSAGFRGCLDGLSIYNSKFSSIETGSSAIQDNITEIYSITVGESGKIMTSDGRPLAPWVERPSGTTQDLNSCKVYNHPDSTIAFAVGNNATVLRSNDKGHSWLNRSILSESTNLYGLDLFASLVPSSSAPGEVHALVCGDSGNIWRSTNVGGNWTWYWYGVGGNNKLNSIVAINHAYWVAVGNRGAVHKTLNGGETWQNLTSLIGDTNSFNKIASPQYDRFCIVGNNGKIYTSTNYGISWQSRNSNTANHLRDVMFSSIDSGIAVGDNGTVRHTTNGGVTWLTDSYFNGLTTRDIISIAMVDGNTVNSITHNSGLPVNSGADSTFFHAASSEPFLGIEPISNFVAEFFNLKQNYPNPFNPVTKIRFDVPANVKGEMSDVKIIIYDISGKEIDILLNEPVRAGQYEVSWNAVNYPSGVYFYTILTDNYKETKKMVLVK